MSRKRYPSDLTDAQWDELAPLLPPDTTRGHPRTTDLREVVNGILYVLRGGIPWLLMPHACHLGAQSGGTSGSGEMTGPGNGLRKPCGSGFGKWPGERLRPARRSSIASR